MTTRRPFALRFASIWRSKATRSSWPRTGEEALAILRRQKITGILLDVNLPGTNGIDLVPQIMDLEPTVALLMLTAVNDATSAALCMQRGALDYLIKPIDLAHLGRAIARALEQRHTMLEGQQINQWLKEEVALRVAERRNEQTTQERISVATLDALVNALEAKDAYLRGHSARVADLSASVAAHLDCADEEIEAVRTAGRLHDIGQIGIREEILNKQGPLTDEEYEHVKQHVLVGCQILAPLVHLKDVISLRPEPPRALGRLRLSRPAGGRSHSARRPHHRCGRDLRRADHGPPLPGEDAARGGGRADARSRRHGHRPPIHEALEVVVPAPAGARVPGRRATT